jgi:hypothetical protein
MKKLYYTIFIPLGISLAINLNAQECADSANIYSFSYEGVSYEIVKENKTWTDAAACAVERGGHLTEVDSQEEQDTIFYFLNNSGIDPSNTVAPDGGGASYIWLGGNDLAVEGDWIWDGDNDGSGPQFWEGTWAGTPVNGLYNNWGGEPDNWNNQDGLGLALSSWPFGDPGQWNDVDDSNTLYFVIEYGDQTGISEPTRIKTDLLIYPNPAHEKINIETQNRLLVRVNLINQLGVSTLQKAFTQNKTNSIDICNFQPGIYYLVLTFENSDIATRLIVIE